ncbi:MarR family transcriptional regulator [Geobacillus subterraneus]|uniref:MarR family transcriptional regulator n=2 Tax=Geobacillus TaxID=129337 RepID=A0ABM6A8V0_9BACL|nr:MULTISPECIES: MarR family transcriptional regulator [Geobacillus]AMX82674.1 MarR family transcriptional regulator [Geobacillus subterraneus]KZS26244.1 MarR family transcriptional regulator [Geobacillus subterraneus]OXB90766.1 MarR family transcriptional regulator [Geobacillus uzenensis]QIZ68602.1 MarR family transcriptional regulator [Geobacillus subterraneus]WPZ17628.1 MarR family transcriptional regulator [Geobacillus subterraneus]
MVERNIDDWIDRYLSVSFLVMKRGAALVKVGLDEEMTHDQYYLLRYIRRRGACTSTELAAMFGVNKSAVTAMTNRLVDKGWLRRDRDESDRRVVALSLTPQGEEWVAEMDRSVYRLVEDVIARFPEKEIETFIRTYEKLARVLQEVEEAR